MMSIIGGIIIGVSVSLMLLFNGRVTGISGIIGNLITSDSLDRSWRILFILGLLTGGLVLRFIHPEAFTFITNAKTLDFIFAGFLVGFGTLLGNGCTSGHGVCGISRLSNRSIVSTLIFILFGMISVVIFKTLRGDV